MSERQSDFDLLRTFTRLGDQGAFADLVRRHIDLVYATALRKVEDHHGAQEISQNVFAALARKAWRFASDDSLPAWLHRTALLESKMWLRGELRRRRREQTAAELGTTMKTPDEHPAVNALVPLLDEALLSLRERDRATLLLRFYETRTYREVGAALGVAEDAAQKRVAGAIERLARFFQRRGFRTATAAAATAALQQTVASASATTTTSVVGAALEAAPHAMSGVAALLARLVSLSKPQVAMLCAAVVVIPVGWAASEHRNAAAEAKRLENEMQAAQTEHSELQSEVEHLRTSLEQLAGLLAQKDEDTTTNAWVIHQFEQWKAKVRAKLTAADYRWPNDSPFVRIPKSVVPKLAAHRPISSPGIISEELRDLLGLTQEERTQVETALRNHFTDMDKLIESRLYETDKTWRVRIPESAVASKVWEVPPLGDEAGARREELLATLKAALGDERWSFFEKDLRMRGTDTLYRILNLGADETAQEAAAWVREEQGKYVVGFAWGERNSMFSSGGQALETFLPGAELPTGLTVEQSLGVRELSPALTGPVLEWVQAQAVSKLEGGFGK